LKAEHSVQPGVVDTPKSTQRLGAGYVIDFSVVDGDAGVAIFFGRHTEGSHSVESGGA